MPKKKPTPVSLDEMSRDPSGVPPPTPTFDVRSEPWIRLQRGTETAEVGLVDALLQAHEWESITDPLPTVEFGLHRLLTALVLDILAPRETQDLEDLLQAGAFAADRIRAYFEDDQRSDRFNLFDRLHPFLQCAGMENEAAKPLAGLMHAVPSGTNALHFHRVNESEFAVAPAIAARLLTTIAPFMTAGGAGLSPSINGAPPWYVLLTGSNLFQTLVLNTPAVADLTRFARPDGGPAWSGSEPVVAERRDGASMLQAFTWQPRRIQLLLGTGGHCALTGKYSAKLVHAMKFAPGWGSGFEWIDPNVPYRISADGRGVMRPQEDREIWRDAGPLALLREADYESRDGRKLHFERPALVTQFTRLVREKALSRDQPLQLIAFGLRTDMKMKVFEWRREVLVLPTPLLLHSEFAALVQNEMATAESVDYALNRAIKRAYPRGGAGNGRAFDGLVAASRFEFWQNLHRHYTGGRGALLDDLASLIEEGAPQQEIEVRLQLWRDRLLAVGWRALESAIDGLDSDAEAIARQVAARNSFALAAWAALHPEAARRARERKKTSTAAA